MRRAGSPPHARSESSWQCPTEAAQHVQRLVAASVARDAEVAAVGDLDLYLVAFAEAECLDDSDWQPDRQAVAPLADLHDRLL